MEIVNGNLVINGYDLNRSAGLGVIGGAAVLLLTILVVVLVLYFYRTQHGKWRWMPGVMLLVVGVSAAATLALPALIDHYVWHDREGEVQSLHRGTGGSAPKGVVVHDFSFERMTEAPGPLAYFYRCVEGDCSTMKPGDSVVAHCHALLWLTVWQGDPSEQCIVRIQ